MLHAIDLDYFSSNLHIPSIASFSYLIIAIVCYSIDFQLFKAVMYLSFSIFTSLAFVAVFCEAVRVNFLAIISLLSVQFLSLSP